MKSPLRWPGAKDKLKREILQRIPAKATLVEPFVGGGSIFLAFLSSFQDRKAIINDADEGIYDLWRIVLKGTDPEFQELIKSIENVVPSVDKFNELKSNNTGFATLCVNRWAFSGNISGGPIGGRYQSSQYKIDCRFDRKDITTNLRRIRYECRGRVKLYNRDFSEVDTPPDAFVYADPPYMNKGDLLYREKMTIRDHRRLYEWITSLPNKWWLSYDDVPSVRRWYKNYEIEELSVLYTTKGSRTNNNRTQELLITSSRPRRRVVRP